MNKYFIFVILVVVVLAGAYFYYAGTQKGQEMPLSGSAPLMPEMSAQMPEVGMMPVMPESPMMMGASGNTYTVEIINNEFRPSVLKIKKGDAVTWINRMANQSWPASAMHPTHAVYPEKGGCIVSAFDACHGLKTDESWGFTFNQVGQWKYHDHINFSTIKPGTIEVFE